MASLTETIPQGAVIYGAAGLIPYAATSLTTVYLAKLAASSEGNVPFHLSHMILLALTISSRDKGGGVFDAETALALLHHVEIVQVGYGAIILSFLGSIHWGLEVSSSSFFIFVLLCARSSADIFILIRSSLPDSMDSRDILVI